MHSVEARLAGLPKRDCAAEFSFGVSRVATREQRLAQCVAGETGGPGTADAQFASAGDRVECFLLCDLDTAGVAFKQGVYGVGVDDAVGPLRCLWPVQCLVGCAAGEGGVAGEVVCVGEGGKRRDCELRHVLEREAGRLRGARTTPAPGRYPARLPA